MTGKEKALERIKVRKKIAEETLSAYLDDLRKDVSFDDLVRKNNALKWDYIKAKTDEERTVIDEKIIESEKTINDYVAKKGVLKSAFRAPYHCVLCNDTGRKDGKECACVEETRKSVLLEKNPSLSGLPKKIEEIDFDYYGEDKEEKKKYGKAIEMMKKEGKKIFLFSGKTGTAKTYMASVLIRELLEEGLDAEAENAVKLNKKFLEYHCAPIEKKKAMWEEINEADALLIDDLGTEQVLNNVTVPYLLELLTDRTEKITVVTTNLNPIELEERYGQRLLSRLLAKDKAFAVRFTGNDLRLRK